MDALRKGDRGSEVRTLQQLLAQRGYPVAADGEFGAQTSRAVRAFQAQNLDQHGQPLVVDGKVGPLTWWSLNHPKPDITTPSAIDFLQLPSADKGGSTVGRAALAAAIGELKAGACEVGGNNCGPWVKKYLAPAGGAEGDSWCTGFVSWCFLQGCDGRQASMPFDYTLGARNLLAQFKRHGWANPPGSGYVPQPGDSVVWWRVSLQGWLGHAGLVHSVLDGMLYTIEGNRSPRVQGFSYVLSRMDQLLGFGHVP